MFSYVAANLAMRLCRGGYDDNIWVKPPVSGVEDRGVHRDLLPAESKDTRPIDVDTCDDNSSRRKPFKGLGMYGACSDRGSTIITFCADADTLTPDLSRTVMLQTPIVRLACSD